MLRLFSVSGFWLKEQTKQDSFEANLSFQNMKGERSCTLKLNYFHFSFSFSFFISGWHPFLKRNDKQNLKIHLIIRSKFTVDTLSFKRNLKEDLFCMTVEKPFICGGQESSSRAPIKWKGIICCHARFKVSLLTQKELCFV